MIGKSLCDAIFDSCNSTLSDSLEATLRAIFEVSLEIMLSEKLARFLWDSLGIPLGNTTEEVLNDR